MTDARIPLSTLNDYFAGLEIEDRGASLLEDFPPNTALLAAVTVAKTMLQKFGAAISEMVRQRDPRLAYLTTYEDTAFLDLALATLPSDAAADNRAETRLLTILDTLPADAAALVALNIAQRAISHSERSGR